MHLKDLKLCFKIEIENVESWKYPHSSSGILCFSPMLNVFLKLDSWQQVRQKLQVWHRNDWFWENKENQWFYYTHLNELRILKM